MKLLIAADHGGFALKEKIEFHYDVENADPDASRVEVVDLGADELIPEDDYPLYAIKLAEALVQQLQTAPDTLGVLICRSGVGMSIAANKVKGCYAALCFTEAHAAKARQHDHANVLVLDADYLDEEAHMEIIHAFLHAQPEPGRHQRRFAQILDYENQHLTA